MLELENLLEVAQEAKPGQIAAVSTALGNAGVNIKNFEVLAIRDEGGAIRMGFATPDEREQARQILEGIGYRVR